MKSLLVPVNFSACADNAARYAADLAIVLKADLHLIHVVQIPVGSAEMVMSEYVLEEMVDSAKMAMEQMQTELRKYTRGKLNIGSVVVAGSLASNIQDRCADLKPYAVVLGVSGPSLEKFLAGSPVSSLLQNVNDPVLVVPGNVRFQPYHHILLACDLTDLGNDLIHFLPLLKDLRDHFGCRFDVITIETQKMLNKENSFFISDGWKDSFRDLYPEIHFIRTPKVEDGVLDYLTHHETDLVMVFPKKHGLLEFHISQSRKLAKRSPIPVLSLHEASLAEQV